MCGGGERQARCDARVPDTATGAHRGERGVKEPESFGVAKARAAARPAASTAVTDRAGVGLSTARRTCFRDVQLGVTLADSAAKCIASLPGRTYVDTHRRVMRVTFACDSCPCAFEIRAATLCDVSRRLYAVTL